jgi:hypothetical protein
VSFEVSEKLLSELSDSEQLKVLELQVPGILYIVFDVKKDYFWVSVTILTAFRMDLVRQAADELTALLKVASLRRPELLSHLQGGDYCLRFLIHLSRMAVVGDLNRSTDIIMSRVKLSVDRSSTKTKAMLFVQISGPQFEAVVKAAYEALSLSSKMSALANAQLLQLSEASQQVCPIPTGGTVSVLPCDRSVHEVFSSSIHIEIMTEAQQTMLMESAWWVDALVTSVLQCTGLGSSSAAGKGRRKQPRQSNDNDGDRPSKVTRIDFQDDLQQNPFNVNAESSEATLLIEPPIASFAPPIMAHNSSSWILNIQ